MVIVSSRHMAIKTSHYRPVVPWSTFRCVAISLTMSGCLQPTGLALLETCYWKEFAAVCDLFNMHSLDRVALQDKNTNSISLRCAALPGILDTALLKKRIALHHEEK